ncbi:MAG: DUF362 domain-containing protein [Promethearchaeota archaeon]
MAKTRVVVRDLNAAPDSGEVFTEELSAAVRDVFEPFGGGSALLKDSGDVYVKPNGIDFKPYAYTRPEVLEAVLLYFREEGARRMFVLENSTQSNYTRLVFEVTGYNDVCKRTGAKPVYLDEEPTETFEFRGKPPSTEDPRGYDLPTFEMSRTVARELVRRRDENTYVDLPKLKTHSMAGVTLGIKNQWGLPRHASRKFDHNYNLHSKLVDVLEHVQPDFTLIDGVEGTIHGHYPPEALHDKCVLPFRVLIGGPDVLSVDIVGARVFGLTPKDVPHLKIAIDRGVGAGVSGLEDVEVLGDLSRFTEKYPTDLYPEFPPTVRLVEGKELACREGCKNNPLALLQVLYLDHGGKGRFDLVFGKGHDPAVIDSLEGPCLVAGHCAIEEVGDRLVSRLGRDQVYFSDGCNNLAQTAAAMFRLMDVNPLDMVPLGLLKSMGILLKAKWHHSHANVPPVLAKYRKYT